MTVPRAIVADDDPDVLMLIEIAVRRAGFVVAASHADGRGALRDALALDPDLLVLDHAMPGMTGGEVIGEVRRVRDDGRPFTVLVSAGVDALADTSVAAGADAYVSKPFSVRELAALLSGRYRA